MPPGRRKRLPSVPVPPRQRNAVRMALRPSCGPRVAPRRERRCRSPSVPSSPTGKPTVPEEAPVRDTINHIVFGWYPYLCLTVFLLGCLLRFDREQYTWKTGSSQLLRRRQLMWGSNLFHIGILVIFIGHFVGLLTPIWVFDLVGISHGFKQVMAIVVGGIAGMVCLIGIALLTHRRLFDHRIRATSSFGDIAVLLLLLTQLLLGLASIPESMEHLDGHEMVKFMDWAQGILLLRTDTWVLVADGHPIFKAHLFRGSPMF